MEIYSSLHCSKHKQKRRETIFKKILDSELNVITNKFSIYFRRDFNVVAYNQTMQQIAASNRPIDVASNSPEPRAEIVEEHLWRHGGPTFKNVQPKSYKILEQQLPQSSMGGK